MSMNKEILTNLSRIGFLALGILSAIGLVGYGLTYIFGMPEVSPDGFVPTRIETISGTPDYFGTILAVFILLYAITILPVTILFTLRTYNLNPYAIIFAGCLAGISALIEIINNLPLVAKGIYPGELAYISPEIRLYLHQVESIRFLAYDVAGFTLIYAAVLVYAIVLFRSHRPLSYTIIASILLFFANVPCLWFAPNWAVILMAISIFALAPVPIFLARIACQETITNL